MSERLPADHLARARAVNPAASYIVQAPAGSGKTSLLTDRIVALLATVERPEQIVAMTFTRKAAAEMHARVLEKLQMALSGHEPAEPNARQGWHLARAALEQDRRMGWNLLQQPSRLRIQTIDSFCASLVKSMPWFSALGGMPSISNNPQELYRQAAAKVIAMAGEEPAVDELLKHLDLNVSLAIEAIAFMLAQRDQWLTQIHHIQDEQAAEQLASDLYDTIQQDLQTLMACMPTGWQHQLAAHARQAAAVLHEAYLSSASPDNTPSAVISLLDWEPGDLGDDPDDLPRWCGLAELLLTGDGALRKVLNANNGCPPKTPHKQALLDWIETWRIGTTPAWVHRLHAVRTMPRTSFSDQQRKILNAQARVLWLAAAQLQLEFTERAEVDFIEVAQRATQALGSVDDPSDLLLKLDQQVSHLLIDEFQDTSKAQLELLETLVSGWQADDGRTLFIVGDPMQSIYRFRKAEVGLFLQVRDHGLGQIDLQSLTLTENFRSSGSVVQWVNDVFSRVLPDEDSQDMGAIRYSPSVAWHPPSDQPAVNWHLEIDDRCVEEKVVELARSAWISHPDSAKPVAILVKSRSHLGQVSLALRRAGLPTRAVDLEPLAERPVVMDLLALARALAHPADRASWIGVLRSAWCGLTLASLHHLLWKRPRHTVPDVLGDWLEDSQAQQALPTEQRSRLQFVAPVLLEALHDDGELPFAARVESVWRTLEGPRLVQEASDLEDAQSFFELMDDLAEHSSLDLDRLEGCLGQLFAAPTAQGARAIEIMTMHKAKGLEFEVVILMGLERSPPPDRPPLVRIEQSGPRILFGPVKASSDEDQDPIARYLAVREGVRQAHETDRLLYVAATRARQTLELVAKVGLSKKANEVMLGSSKSLLAKISDFCPQEIQERVLERLQQQAATVQASEATPYWRGPSLWRRRDVPVVSDRSRPEHTQSLLTYGGWPEQVSSERLVGTLLHAWFAHFVQSQDRRRPDLQHLEVQLGRLGVARPLRQEAAQRVLQGLQAMLASQRGQWLLEQTQARVEWSLVDQDETVSVIDLAIDQGSCWLVVDYKTSVRRADESQAEFELRMVQRYRPQMTRYVDQLRAFDGRDAKAALYFPLDDLWLEMDV